MASHFRITDSAISAFVVRHCRQTAIPIKLCGSLARGRAIMIKVTKPNQDMRFDVPVIGVETIRVAAEAKSREIAIEARKTLLLEQDAIVDLANRSNTSIVAR